MSEAEEEPAYRPPPDDGDAEEEEFLTVEELEARLAVGHMLSAISSQNSSNRRRRMMRMRRPRRSPEKLGHMLTADEKEELNAAVVLSSGHTADTLTAKLAAGHMLTADQKEELREATAQRLRRWRMLSARVWLVGHMLTDAELEQAEGRGDDDRFDARRRQARGQARRWAHADGGRAGGAAQQCGRARAAKDQARRSWPAKVARWSTTDTAGISPWAALTKAAAPSILGASRPERVQLLAATAGCWWWKKNAGPPGLTRSNASSGGGGSGAASSRPSRPEWVDAAAPALPMGRRLRSAERAAARLPWQAWLSGDCEREPTLGGGD